MALFLTEADLTDGMTLWADLRKADLEEWVMGSGKPAHEALLEAATLPDTWAVRDEHGACVAMWGVTPARGRPEVGIAWMAVANAGLERVHEMHRFFRLGIARMHAQFPHLEACSSHHNDEHHRWMLRMGFEFEETIVLGPLGWPFFLFTRDED